MTGVGSLIAHASEQRDTGVIIAVVLLAVLGVWLHGVHRIQGWNDRIERRRTWLMLLGVHVVLGALLIVASEYLLFLFGAYSITFAFADRVRDAIALSAIVTAIWLWAWFHWELPAGGAVTPLLVFAVINIINHFVTRVADQSEERGRLLAELEETRGQLAATERQRGTLAERERLAAEIHDTLAQGFTSIVLLSEVTRRTPDIAPEALDKNLGMIENTARSNLDEARRLVDALRPAVLDGRTLGSAIELAAQRAANRTGAELDVVIIGDDRGLGGAVDLTLLRVTQEALANIEKHADADQISISLTVGETYVELTVVDDGCGLPESTAVANDVVADGVRRGGHGLGLMRERVESLHGTVEVESSADRGTTVLVRLPLPA